MIDEWQVRFHGVLPALGLWMTGCCGRVSMPILFRHVLRCSSGVEQGQAEQDLYGCCVHLADRATSHVPASQLAAGPGDGAVA
eukprot:COSAG06_NODE_426_length_15905_cov_35.386436_2_plen_83_part_00